MQHASQNVWLLSYTLLSNGVTNFSDETARC